VTPKQCRAARMAVGFSASALATAAGLKTFLVARFERGDVTPDDVHDTLQRTLEVAGVDFLAADGGTSGVRLREAVR
jgi:ribosome-binding protein aMBF1 (putative translation factor)